MSQRDGYATGCIFIAGGFMAIAKAWFAAASVLHAAGQFPYILSGGFLGVGMLLVGSTLIGLSQLRRESREMNRQFGEVADMCRALIRLQPMMHLRADDDDGDPGQEGQ